MRVVLVLLILMVGPVLAEQACGPVVRGLEGTLSPPPSSPAAASKTKRDSFFSGVGSGGQVLNLNTGEVLTER